MFKWFGKVNFTPSTKVARFAEFLKDGHLMASRCRACGAIAFPPRADCEACLAGDFEWVELTGRATLHTFTRVAAAPTGFEDAAPYVLGLVDLEEGGRALATFGATVSEDEIQIGMKLQLVPRMFEEIEEIKVYYELEKPGTQWTKSPSLDSSGEPGAIHVQQPAKG